MQFHFADYVLDTSARELRLRSELIAVEPQVYDLLLYLIENRDRVVTKDDLVASVWGGRVTSDATLTSRIYAVRKAVGDSGQQQKLIRTIPRKGLRFVGAVRTPSMDELGELCAEPALNQSVEPIAALPLPDRPAIAVLPFANMPIAALEQAMQTWLPVAIVRYFLLMGGPTSERWRRMMQRAEAALRPQD